MVARSKDSKMTATSGTPPSQSESFFHVIKLTLVLSRCILSFNVGQQSYHSTTLVATEGINFFLIFLQMLTLLYLQSSVLLLRSQILQTTKKEIFIALRKRIPCMVSYFNMRHPVCQDDGSCSVMNEFGGQSSMTGQVISS